MSDVSSAEEVIGGGLFGVFADFFSELRNAGVPVSTTEALDAMEALRHIPLEDREALKHGLAAALVKQEGHWRAFEALFEVYFSVHAGLVGAAGEEGPVNLGPQGEGLTPSELAELAYKALMEGDAEALAGLAHAAVSRFAGMEPGRPVGGSYYVFKTLRQLQADALLDRLLSAAQETGGLEGLVLAEEYRRRLERLKEEISAEVNRRLVAERGPEEVARAMRRPLPEDVDFMHLARDELAALQRTVEPLARRLAVHMARKRRRRNEGRLDFRATMRRSLSSGGAPADPRFKARQRSKPELWVLADISGSVAAFARFTLQLVYALSSQFARTRSWAFIDGIDEVTDLLRGADDMAQAVRSINNQAEVIWNEGHSDYGHALSELVERWGRELTSRTTVIILGDARNNYHAAHTWAVAELARRSRQVWWLNPEPQAYWDTGDSLLAQYGAHCTGVHECRNLRQLRLFVEQLP
ncbi:MAG TPA: VWA domain-containing protein [Acidimicrobiales bacterium]|nr:VWA domain-containing protein [Acidimicrobiales bacterium]